MYDPFCSFFSNFGLLIFEFFYRLFRPFFQLLLCITFFVTICHEKKYYTRIKKNIALKIIASLVGTCFGELLQWKIPPNVPRFPFDIKNHWGWILQWTVLTIRCKPITKYVYIIMYICVNIEGLSEDIFRETTRKQNFPVFFFRKFLQNFFFQNFCSFLS